jgi:hypothetical protein
MFNKFVLMMLLVLFISAMIFADEMTTPNKAYWSYGLDVLTLLTPSANHAPGEIGNVYFGSGLSYQNNQAIVSFDVAITGTNSYTNESGDTFNTVDNMILTLTTDYYLVHPSERMGGFYAGLGLGYSKDSNSAGLVNSPLLEAIVEYRRGNGNSIFMKMQGYQQSGEATESSSIGIRVSFDNKW